MKRGYFIAAIAVSLLITGCASIRRAEQLYNRYEYVKAAPIYEKLADRNSRHTGKSMQRLGDINRLSSHFEQSADWYKKAIAAGNSDSEMLINYGQVLRSLGRYDEAIEQFENYSKINPTDNRARLYADFCRQFLSREDKVEFFEIANLKGLNSQYSDFSPVVFEDGIVFTSDRSQGVGTRLYGWTGAFYLDLYKAKMPDFADPEKELSAELLSTNLNMAFHDGPATFSPDFKKVYFTRVYRKMGEIDTSRFYTNKLKIFTSEYDGKKWSDPVGFYLNSDEYSVGHPAVSADGNTLYFVSDMAGGHGGTDIYSVDMVNGSWTNLQNLGPEINTFGNEMFPFIDDSGVLYFSSDGIAGLGSLDIFKTTYSDGKWSEPENMKEPINSSADDFGFYRDKNGKILFSSNRPGGQGSDDIYMASVIKYADSVLVTGLVKDRNTGDILANTTVALWDVATDEVIILKTDSKGEYSRILYPGHTYVFKSVKEGYTTDCLTLAIPQYTREDKHKNRDLLLVKLKVNEIFRLENVYYDFDKYNIRPDAAAELDRLLNFLTQNPGVNVELGSHTDCRGTHKYNERLAERRAESAVKYIHDKGISKERITAKGYGETQLVNKCSDGVDCTEDEHQANRRTEIKITGITYEGQSEDYEPLDAYKDGQKIKLSSLNKDFFSNCAEDKGI
jgi:outer membrane protein OmpA-like peptidoglycan-associated protein/Tol biopolymer transport system component